MLLYFAKGSLPHFATGRRQLWWPARAGWDWPGGLRPGPSAGCSPLFLNYVQYKSLQKAAKSSIINLVMAMTIIPQITNEQAVFPSSFLNNVQSFFKKKQWEAVGYHITYYIISLPPLPTHTNSRLKKRLHIMTLTVVDRPPSDRLCKKAWPLIRLTRTL